MPAALVTFAEADWLAAPVTDAEADMFGDEAYWAAHPDMASKLQRSLALERWIEARLSWADANLGAEGWCDVFVETAGIPSYTRPAW